MTYQRILEYEILSMSYVESIWSRIFPNYIINKVNRKIKRHNESADLYNNLKGEEILLGSRYPLKSVIPVNECESIDEPFWMKDDFPTRDNNYKR